MKFPIMHLLIRDARTVGLKLIWSGPQHALTLQIIFCTGVPSKISILSVLQNHPIIYEKKYQMNKSVENLKIFLVNTASIFDAALALKRTCHMVRLRFGNTPFASNPFEFNQVKTWITVRFGVSCVALEHFLLNTCDLHLMSKSCGHLCQPENKPKNVLITQNVLKVVVLGCSLATTPSGLPCPRTSQKYPESNQAMPHCHQYFWFKKNSPASDIWNRIG